jgi:hypothetical protein
MNRAWVSQAAEWIENKEKVLQTIARDLASGQIIIRSKCNRKIDIPHDAEAYKWRHLINNYVSKIKDFRGVNTR